MYLLVLFRGTVLGVFYIFSKILCGGTKMKRILFFLNKIKMAFFLTGCTMRCAPRRATKGTD
jgi:hypothetical protein